MAEVTNGRSLLPTELRNRFKFEVADSLGIDLKPGYNGDMTARNAGAIGGKIGGNMVRVMIRFAEEAMREGRF